MAAIAGTMKGMGLRRSTVLVLWVFYSLDLEPGRILVCQEEPKSRSRSLNPWAAENDGRSTRLVSAHRRGGRFNAVLQ
jgi:hypothetical protein